MGLLFGEILVGPTGAQHCSAIISHGDPIAVARQLLTGGSISGLAAMIIAPTTFITIEACPERRSLPRAAIVEICLPAIPCENA